MKKLVFTISALLISAIISRAELGATYAQDCKRYGKATVDKVRKCVYWHVSKRLIVERFVKNECVMVRLIPDKGLAYSLNDVQRMLPYECGSEQVWQLFDGGSSFLGSWQTTDGLILASLYPTGDVQFAYRWWIEGKGLLTDQSNSAAPVEDGIAGNDGTNI
jgi:hypothetical protein